MDYNWKDPATIISFAVDNNPRDVAAELVSQGINIQGLNIPDYKPLIFQMFTMGKDISWIYTIPYMASQSNWTGVNQITNGRAIVNQNIQSRTALESIGDFLTNNMDVILPVVGAAVGVPIFGAGLNANNQNNSAIPPPEKTILGLDQTTFIGLSIVMIILIILIVVMYRKK